MPHAPRPAYYFVLQWGGSNLGFSEVSGLAIQSQPMRIQAQKDFNKEESYKAKFANIVLKRGITTGDTEFYQWINAIRRGKIERTDILISLLDATHTSVITWKVHNAWPVKIESGPLNAKGSEVAMETIELVHEGLEMVV